MERWGSDETLGEHQAWPPIPERTLLLCSQDLGLPTVYKRTYHRKRQFPGHRVFHKSLCLWISVSVREMSHALVIWERSHYMGK